MNTVYKFENGRIVSAGKFEGEEEWVPYFWDLVLEGYEDETEDEDNDGCSYYSVFEIKEEDILRFSSLLGYDKVRLHEDQFGFVYGEKLVIEED